MNPEIHRVVVANANRFLSGRFSDDYWAGINYRLTLVVYYRACQDLDDTLVLRNSMWLFFE